MYVQWLRACLRFCSGHTLTEGGIALVETNESHRTEMLSGWKEISSYLRMGVRTVQRYQESGLPVRRPAGKPRGSVIATKTELDAWVAACPIRRPVSRSKAGSSLAWTDFRAGMAEMKRLRTEMLRLRMEAVTLLEALHARVAYMQGARGGEGVELPNLMPQSQGCVSPATSGSNWLVMDSRQRPDQLKIPPLR